MAKCRTYLPAYTSILPPWADCCQNASLLVSHDREAEATPYFWPVPVIAAQGAEFMELAG